MGRLLWPVFEAGPDDEFTVLKTFGTKEEAIAFAVDAVDTLGMILGVPEEPIWCEEVDG